VLLKKSIQFRFWRNLYKDNGSLVCHMSFNNCPPKCLKNVNRKLHLSKMNLDSIDKDKASKMFNGCRQPNHQVSLMLRQERVLKDYSINRWQGVVQTSVSSYLTIRFTVMWNDTTLQMRSNHAIRRSENMKSSQRFRSLIWCWNWKKDKNGPQIHYFGPWEYSLGLWRLGTKEWKKMNQFGRVSFVGELQRSI